MTEESIALAAMLKSTVYIDGWTIWPAPIATFSDADEAIALANQTG
jgi:hypothetical protein